MKLYHVSLSVPELEVGMEWLTRDLEVSWRPVIESVKTQVDASGASQTVLHRLAYSEGGPPAIELVQRGPDEEPAEASGDAMVIDHLGFWVVDLGAEWQRLLQSGWTPRGKRTAEVPKGAGQLVNDRGLAIEIVDVRVERPHVADLYPRDSPHFRPAVTVGGAQPGSVPAGSGRP
jgi:hypothetical protein